MQTSCMHMAVLKLQEQFGQIKFYQPMNWLEVIFPQMSALLANLKNLTRPSNLLFEK